KKMCFDEYVLQLRTWQGAKPNGKVQAVLRYVEAGAVVSDLIRVGVLHCGSDNQLLTEWSADPPPPDLLKMLPPKDMKMDQGDAFVRWRVQVPGDPVSALWEDPRVCNSWIEFLSSLSQNRYRLAGK